MASKEDLAYYTSKFEKTGFTGGLNYYRALNINWELTAPWTGAKVKVPVKFIVGDLDLTYNTMGAKDYIEKGGFKKDVPLLEDVIILKVLLIHGLPELWYSWRHQILFLADHGYRAVAPDLRGFGDTTGAPINDPTKFTIHHLVGDTIGVIDAITKELGEKVFVVGHDWGAIIAWHLCLFRPDRVKGLVNMSVPFIPWTPDGDIVTMLRSAFGEDHYMTRFQVSLCVTAKQTLSRYCALCPR
ncbi:hypothetical protein L1987_72203 [Smallanthus sonchifolius]|uniref:Uncharacterized protein n=1 Tax=Smallanthus sonchifolius TaxID=185202 RepID=A0ACB9AYY1_9ASTR|nr:hypothetical protein L1987_72203 [Smallanthus sonchifolius]